MKKVLFVDCCIRRGESRSKELATHFLSELEKTGEYELETLCLMDENLSHFADGFFQQRQELLEADDLQHPRFRYAHQFAAADKIVIAAPFWDLSFPALLKVYIENLCVDGITFHSGAEGLQGLCKADHLVYLTTRGGIYKGSDMEMGSAYLEKMCVFFGIDRYDCIAAEGLDMGIAPVEELLGQAKAEASAAVQKF